MTILGNELTNPGDMSPNSGNKPSGAYGHALAYNLTKHPAMGVSWPDTINEVKGQGGFVYYAHPYKDAFVYPDTVFYDETSNFHGVEVVNGNGYDTDYNLAAMDFWDQINTRGEKKYFGVSNSDAHYAIHAGNWFNKALLNDLNKENVIDMLYYGTSYGSNGPDLRFEIDGMGMGGTLKAPGAHTAVFKIAASDRFSELSKITVYGFEVNGTTVVNKTTVYEANITGNYYEHTFSAEVKPGQYYRVEVVSARGAYINVKGFAYSNPIWIEEGVSNSVTRSSLAYSGGEIVENDWEGMFLLSGKDKYFDIEDVEISGGTAASVKYNKRGGNRAGVLTVTYTAADGRQLQDTFWVVDKAAYEEPEHYDAVIILKDAEGAFVSGATVTTGLVAFVEVEPGVYTIQNLDVAESDIIYDVLIVCEGYESANTTINAAGWEKTVILAKLSDGDGGGNNTKEPDGGGSEEKGCKGSARSSFAAIMIIAIFIIRKNGGKL